jgi:hypothetical protein
MRTAGFTRVGGCILKETIIWKRFDRPSLEFFQCETDQGFILRGNVVGDIDGLLGQVIYRVRADSDSLTGTVRIQLLSHSGPRYLRLSRNPQGQWHANGTERPDLVDATDVDIGVTPSTNTLPIRRFHLAVGASRDLVAAWIRFPELSVIPVRQRYTRVTKDQYLYESLDSGYQAKLTVQNDGLVVHYADIWRALIL